MNKVKLKQNTQVFFDEITHTYLTKKDKELIGVTTLMQIMGVSPDYGGIEQEVLDKAAARGTEVHKAIEHYCKGEETGELSDNAVQSLEAFRQLGLNVIANEYLVSDNKHIASSIDLTLDTDEPDTVDLADIKTTYRLHEEAVSWQLSIYKYLFELQNPKLKVRNLYALHLRGSDCDFRQVAEVPREQVQGLIQSYVDGTAYAKPTPTDLIAPDAEHERAIILVQKIEGKIRELNAQVKIYEERQKEWKEKIMTLMKEHHVKQWQVSEALSFTYVEPYAKVTLDSKRLKAELPDIYAQYAKESQVKETLKINIK